MYILLNLLFMLIVHLSAAIFYPYIGKVGAVFLFISSLLWTSFLIFTRPAVMKFSNDTTIFLAILINIFMLTEVATLTPQLDGVSIFKKIIRNQYPTKKDVYFGLLNFGIKYEPLLVELKKEELSR